MEIKTSAGTRNPDGLAVPVPPVLNGSARKKTPHKLQRTRSLAARVKKTTTLIPLYALFEHLHLVLSRRSVNEVIYQLLQWQRSMQLKDIDQAYELIKTELRLDFEDLPEDQAVLIEEPEAVED